MREFFNKVGKKLKGNPDAIVEGNYTKLQRAIVENDLKKVKSLIKDGANVNYSGALLYPPLHLAMVKNNLPVMLALIEAGADLNLGDAFGRKPLHLAVENGQESFVLMLLKLKADPNVKDNLGKTPLHEVQPAHLPMIDALFSHGALLSEQDNMGNTPLHLALVYNPAIAEKLLALGADPNVRNKKGVSPYVMMLEEGRLHLYPKMLQKMIALKTDYGSASPLGETVLHLAVRLEMEETFLNAVTNPELSARDEKGNNILHALVRTQNTLMIARVLERAPELLRERNHAGFTPLEELVRASDNPSFGMVDKGDKYIATVRLLLRDTSGIDCQDNLGRGLLHLSVSAGKLELLEELLKKGADPDIVDNKNKTPLHYAIAKKDISAMDVLLDNNADPDMTDDRGWTILDRMAEQGDRDSPMVQRLIVSGGQYKKQLPLHPEMIRPRIVKPGRIGGAQKPSGGHTAGPQGPRI